MDGVGGAGPLLPKGRGKDSTETLAQPPARGDAAVRQVSADIEARSASAARPLPDTYLTGTTEPRPLAGTSLPYNAATVYGYDRDVTRDRTGVRMVPIAGRLYDHPVVQAQDALMSLSDYRLTGRPRHLRRAELDAQRLVDNRVLSGDAWYLPYPYDFALHGRATVMRAPWFSAMAQGLALSVFVRLYRITGRPAWRAAADATFKSFENAPARGLPSTVSIDASRYLWFQEYPRWPTPASDHTLNGHVFALFGVYDYLVLTGNRSAFDLWNAGLRTTRWYVQHGFRDPGHLSRYCLRHPNVRSAGYHDIHWHQMIALHAATGDAGWSQLAEALRADQPGG